MINNLHLINFQGHQDNTFVFNPGLTVICGPSGSGKSSVIRALKYLFYNRPNHVKYQRRPDAKFFKIESDIDNISVQRVKGKVGKEDLNQYSLNGGKDNGGLTWDDVGRSVPEKITELVNIKPVVFNKEIEFDIQLAQQFDGQFLLSQPDSVKLKFLNRLSGSYIVDLAAKNISKELGDCKKEVESLNDSIEELDKKLKNIVELSGPFSIILDKIRNEYVLLCENIDKLNKLQNLKKEFDQCEQVRLSIIKDETLLSKVNIEGFELAINRIEELVSLFEDYKYVQEQLNLTDTLLNKVGGIQLDQLLLKTSLLADLVVLNAQYKEVGENLLSLEKDQQLLDKEYGNVVQCYKEQLQKTSVCPYCNQKISQTCINKLLKEL